jgi:Flp pilus assembly protein TadD
MIQVAVSVLIAVAVVLCPSRVNADDKTDRQFESITRLLEKADKEREAGHPEEAGRLYGATIAAYQNFHRNFPDEWVELVQFRIAYCRNQLMNLLADKHVADRKTEPAPEEPKRPPLPEGVTKSVAEGVKMCREGRYTDAETTMQAVVEEHPNCGEAYLVLGTACVGKGDLEMAITLIRRAATLDPISKEAHYNLSQLLIRAATPDFDSARTHYRQALKLGASRDADLEAVLGLE